MTFVTEAVAASREFIPFLSTVLVVILVTSILNRSLRKRWRDKPEAQFRFQLIMLLTTLIGVLAVVVALPVSDALRNQLLSLIGVLLSAAIALSSTTFIGNILAGIMLKVIRSARPGDFITIGDLTGRITEMDLLHTEVQTEFRNLVTVPNLVMVTKPLEVVRASGTIVTAEVSLGYEHPQSDIRKLLCKAAEDAGLSDPFAHVRVLGDFSVTYRAAGLLVDVQSLISARAKLRASMLDTLHAAGIEIVSPTFMNTRALAAGEAIIPVVKATPGHEDAVKAESLAFDKAEEAASIEELRKSIEVLTAEIEKPDAEGGGRTAAELERLEAKRARLAAILVDAEKRHSEKE
ncbi:MAG: mechanosensitive ion channel [Woeseiaceae bacterium]|nr:mechanosensitive ion channel [Woeseiaceae bacterium]